MSRQPNIPHQDIVDYVLAGHTTREAKEFFDFRNDNIANLRVYAAFKALSIPRPRYTEQRTCQYCGQGFAARDIKQRSCGREECQRALILEWQSQNLDKVRNALQKYRGTEKGRQNNIRMHRRRRELGRFGTAQEKWNFAATEIKKSLRKLFYLADRNPWEYRIQHLQKVAQARRRFNPRNQRKLSASIPSGRWQAALRAAQTTLFQYECSAASSVWERRATQIQNALRTGAKVREWKRN